MLVVLVLVEVDVDVDVLVDVVEVESQEISLVQRVQLRAPTAEKYPGWQISQPPLAASG